MANSSIPDNIRSAIECLLEPYGLQFELVDSSSKAEKRFLDVKGAVTYTSLERWNLSRATKAGKLPHIKLSAAMSGKVLYDIKDLDRFLLRCKK